MTLTRTSHSHCPIVLDLLVPVDVVDGVENVGGDLGDLAEPLDVIEEGEELLLDDRIEREQTSFSL